MISLLKQELQDTISVLADKTDNNGLMLGLTGHALFYAVNNDLREHSNLGILLEKLSKSLDNFSGYNFSSGLSGFWFLLEYLNKNGRLDQESHGYLDKLRHICAYGFDKYYAVNNHDYLHGYLGIYNVHCYSDHKTDAFEGSFLTDLLYAAISMAKTEMVDEPGDRRLNSLLNFGLAHGVPSLLSVLVNRYRRFGNMADLVPIEAAVQFIIAQRSVTDLPSRYPSALGGDLENKKSRLAWCYGDLGVNLVLLKASKAIGNESLEREILDELVLSSKRISYPETGVKDCSFCHGASGLIFYFKYLYQETGLPDFRTASEYWTALVLERYKQSGIQGFKTYYSKLGWRLESGILEGLIGIYMALFYEEVDHEFINYMFLTNLN